MNWILLYGGGVKNLSFEFQFYFFLKVLFNLYLKWCNHTKSTEVEAKPALPYLCLVGTYKEETILFPTELSEFYSHEEIRLVNFIFKRYMHDGLLIYMMNQQFKY